MRCVLSLLSLPSSPSGRYTLRRRKDILLEGGAQPLPDERQHLFQKFLDRLAVAVCYLFGAFRGRVVFRVVAQERRQLRVAILSPLLEADFGHFVGQLLVGESSP